MHIRKVEIRNFRLLKKIEVLFEEGTTVVVGRNNSGKTSLTEFFRRLFDDDTPSFRFEDFSLSVHEDFWNAFNLWRNERPKDEIRQTLPYLEITLTVKYDATQNNNGLLGEFIVDLNLDCDDVRIVVRYALKDGQLDDFFSELIADTKSAFCREIRDRIPKHFSPTVQAEDPNDFTNRKEIDFAKLRHLVLSGFISAQRGLDDITHKDINLLGKVLENLLASAGSDTADEADQQIIERLELAIEEIQSTIDQGFNKQLQDLLPAFKIFGYPGLSDPKLITETNLDVQRLLKNHTRVHYAGVNGINLPETYNGLGVRNLVLILLRVYEFFKSFKSREGEPGIHIVFIEEPEVHLHPQMQEVFIAQLSKIASVFAEKFNAGMAWPVQFVVTTHSSHVANRAKFDAMRYFYATSVGEPAGFLASNVKDLRVGLGGTPQENRDFLHKYMTLTRCDLLFADKAVLIEGATERLLLPSIIAKLDAATGATATLGSQYLSVVEVGGNFAHIFFSLLNFLELRALVVTDIDTVDTNQNGKSAIVSQANATSNQCIVKWFSNPSVTPKMLLDAQETEKIKANVRLAYQVPESTDGPCGRTFEDAFLLANLDLFGPPQVPAQEREDWASAEAAKIRKKSDFALEYAIVRAAWNVPRYLSEGLRWLASDGKSSPEGPAEPAAQQ